MIDHDDLDATLRGMGLVDAAAEYHGALCGALCVQAQKDIKLLTLVEPDTGGAPTADAAARQMLETLRDQTHEALTDEQMSFHPLLPDDQVALGQRVVALGAWCQGFLFGLASKPGLDLARCTEEVREVVQDLTELTRATVGEDEDEDEDANIQETAYAELVEYIRVGAQLVFMELHPRPTLDPSDSQRLH